MVGRMPPKPHSHNVCKTITFTENDKSHNNLEKCTWSMLFTTQRKERVLITKQNKNANEEEMIVVSKTNIVSKT